MSVSGTAAALSADRGGMAPAEDATIALWIAVATASLPVPVSPSTKTS